MTCWINAVESAVLTSVPLLVSICERGFRGRQKRHETIGCPYCFPRFCCYGWHVLSFAEIPTMSQLVPPAQPPPPSSPLPPAIITSPPLCFPSISIVYASLVSLGPCSIFRHASLLCVKLLSFFPNLCTGLFFPVRCTVELAQTRVHYLGLGWVGPAFLGQWDTTIKVFTLILFAPVPSSDMWTPHENHVIPSDKAGSMQGVVLPV